VCRADPQHKNLRARFLRECLQHVGFHVDMRQDRVNAWLRSCTREVAGDRLDIVGRLIAYSRQLDLSISDEASMHGCVAAFLSGNYRVRAADDAASGVTDSAGAETSERPR
jgi:pyruvate, water dikinase